MKRIVTCKKGISVKLEYTAIAILITASAVLKYSSVISAEMYVDEKIYARAAYSLLQGHLASGSSFLEIYREFGLNRSDIYTPYGYVDSVEPWLDHPPLIPLLLAPLLALGAAPRILPVIFASSSAMLIYLLLCKQRPLAIIAVLIFLAYFQVHPILSMLFLDSGVAFFNLLTLVLTAEHHRSRRSIKLLYLAGAFAGLSALSKAFGVASILYLLIYIIYDKVKHPGESLMKYIAPFSLAIAVASIWPLYALVVSPSLFIRLQWANAARSVFSNRPMNEAITLFLITLLGSYAYTESEMSFTGLDPFLFIGWIALGYSLSKAYLRLVHASLLSYLAVILAFRYAWFYTTIPLFPFYSIAVAVLLADTLRIVPREAR